MWTLLNKQLTPLEIINLLGHEPRKIQDNGELALNNKKIPIKLDVLNTFKIGGRAGFTYLGEIH